MDPWSLHTILQVWSLLGFLLPADLTRNASAATRAEEHSSELCPLWVTGAGGLWLWSCRRQAPTRVLTGWFPEHTLSTGEGGSPWRNLCSCPAPSPAWGPRDSPAPPVLPDSYSLQAPVRGSPLPVSVSQRCYFSEFCPSGS